MLLTFALVLGRGFGMTASAKTPPHFHQGLAERLAIAGLSPLAAQSLLDLDIALFQFHRMSMKGEIPGQIIAELGIGLDLSQFYALTAVSRIQNGVARTAPEPATIGLLAEEMAIDPSRASRIAADLIQNGYLRREALQEDGRKSVLVLTDKALTAFARFRDRKWDRVVEVFSGWSDEDMTLFSSLFTRYADRMRSVYGNNSPGAETQDT